MNPREITSLIEQMSDIPKSNMSIRPRHRVWGINPHPHVLSRKTQAYEISVHMAPSTETTLKSPGKLASSSANHFQTLNIYSSP